MATVDDPRTLGRARLAFFDQHDIDEFVSTLEKFEHENIGLNEWRAFRLVRGAYGQRQDSDFHLLRVKVPHGCSTSASCTNTMPQCFVMVGGKVREDGASFARTAAKTPARRIPLALERLGSTLRSTPQTKPPRPSSRASSYLASSSCLRTSK